MCRITRTNTFHVDPSQIEYEDDVPYLNLPDTKLQEVGYVLCKKGDNLCLIKSSEGMEAYAQIYTDKCNSGEKYIGSFHTHPIIGTGPWRSDILYRRTGWR